MSHFIISSGPTWTVGMPNGTRQHAVRAGDAARLQSAADDAVLPLLDRIGRTHQRARRFVAVHADHRRRGDRVRPVDVVHVDHRDAAMACRTRRRRRHRRGSRCSVTDRQRTRSRSSGPFTCCGSCRNAVQPVRSPRAGSPRDPPARDVFSIRQAETLYSGILLRGSRVRCVSSSRSAGPASDTA